MKAAGCESRIVSINESFAKPPDIGRKGIFREPTAHASRRRHSIRLLFALNNCEIVSIISGFSSTRLLRSRATVQQSYKENAGMLIYIENFP